jgi:hypothetical protein
MCWSYSKGALSRRPARRSLDAHPHSCASTTATATPPATNANRADDCIRRSAARRSAPSDWRQRGHAARRLPCREQDRGNGVQNRGGAHAQQRVARWSAASWRLRRLGDWATRSSAARPAQISTMRWCRRHRWRRPREAPQRHARARRWKPATAGQHDAAPACDTNRRDSLGDAQSRMPKLGR